MNVEKQYYKKELVSRPLYLDKGNMAPFQPVGDDTGVLSTDDANIIFQLNNLVSAGRGGVLKITKAQYDELIELKKKAEVDKPQEVDSLPFGRHSTLRPSPTLDQILPRPQEQPSPVEAAAAAVADKQAQPKLQPRKGRASKAKDK